MQKKLVKAVTASLMAAAMLSTTAATFAPMSVSAGMCVGETSFNVKQTRLSRHLQLKKALIQ